MNKLSLFEKFCLGWFWVFYCFVEWEWLMRSNDCNKQLFQCLNTDVFSCIDER